jgi:hypothetical protein
MSDAHQLAFPSIRFQSLAARALLFWQVIMQDKMGLAPTELAGHTQFEIPFKNEQRTEKKCEGVNEGVAIEKGAKN